MASEYIEKQTALFLENERLHKEIRLLQTALDELNHKFNLLGGDKALEELLKLRGKED